MDEDRLLRIEGRLAALELISPMFVAQLSAKGSDERSMLITILEALAAGYNFPPDRHPAFVEGFTGCFDEVAAKLRESP